MAEENGDWESKYDDVFPMLDGYDDYGHFIEKDGLLGFATFTGYEIIPCAYDKFKQSYGTTMFACLGGRWGSLDVVTGQTVIPFLYQSLEGFTCEGENPDLAVCELGGLFGLLNVSNGETVIPPTFASIDSNEITDSNDLIRAMNPDGKYGFINQRGQITIDPIYDEAPCVFSEDSIEVTLGKERFRINREGQKI